MLKISTLEFFVRLIPEVVLFMLSAYAFSKTRINKKKYIYSSVLFGVAVFCIRFLPINYGVHTIISIIVLIIIATVVCNIDIIESIKASIITAITLFLCEGVNIVILNVIFKDNLKSILEDPRLKTICSIPSLICFALVVLIYYNYLRKRGQLKDV